MISKRFLWLYWIALFCCSMSFAQAPQSISTKAPETTAAAVSSKEIAPGHELTAEDLGAFFDGLIPLQIGQADVAGAVIAIVKDGEQFFARGYGYADAAKKTLISPEKTLFRAGSIAKLFIWTAVM